MSRTCPRCFSAEEVTLTPGVDGLWEFTCSYTSRHDPVGVYTWLDTRDSGQSLGGVDRSLDPYYDPLRACLTTGEPWLEYAVVEWRFRAKAPGLFKELADVHGHRLLNPRKTRGHTASAYLVHSLGRMRARGEISRIFGDATGPWKHQTQVSYWAAPPDPPSGSRLSWDAYAELNGISQGDWKSGPDATSDRTG